MLLLPLHKTSELTEQHAATTASVYDDDDDVAVIRNIVCRSE